MMEHHSRRRHKKQRLGHEKEEAMDTEQPAPLDEGDVALLKAYECAGPYSAPISKLEKEIEVEKIRVKEMMGVVESDTGLSPPSQWDFQSDTQMMMEESPLLVGHCKEVLEPCKEDLAEEKQHWLSKPKDGPAGNSRYRIKIGEHMGQYVVGLGEKMAPSDIEEGMRIGVDRSKFSIQIPLPTKIEESLSLMTVEDKPDTTFDDVGGVTEAVQALREVMELPLLHPERFLRLGIEPPKGVLLYGPPGTGKTLAARAVANSTNACFIRVIGSELVKKYVGEGARTVRELFKIARTKRACVLFFDEIDAIGTTRSDEAGEGGDNEVQRTMLQIAEELDGFDPRGNIKVMMATNRPDILDPCLVRPGRLDRKIEFSLPDLAGRIHILRIHTRRMSTDPDIRLELIARLCPSTTGADLKCLCTEAGMFCLRARRKSVSEKDFLDSVNKVIKGYKKFSSTPKYMVYN